MRLIERTSVYNLTVSTVRLLAPELQVACRSSRGRCQRRSSAARARMRRHFEFGVARRSCALLSALALTGVQSRACPPPRDPCGIVAVPWCSVVPLNAFKINKLISAHLPFFLYCTLLQPNPGGSRRASGRVSGAGRAQMKALWLALLPLILGAAVDNEFCPAHARVKKRAPGPG